jgi:hypothetical protein
VATTGRGETVTEYRGGDQPRILHGYTRCGVKSEALAGVGRVVRVGLDPQATAPGQPVAGDMTEAPVDPSEIDLAFLQPPCSRWSPLTSAHGDPEDYPNLIPDARRFGQECGDYIIENVPDAPLSDPLLLEGRAFNLPIKMERGVETSFPVDQPPIQTQLPVSPDGYDSENLVQPGRYQADMARWRSVKGYTRDYLVAPFKRTAIPRAYVDYLLRGWLREVAL